MKAHVQNPYTRNPSLMVNLTVEEVKQLDAALATIKEACIASHVELDRNQEDAFNQLRTLLEEKLNVGRPNGLKGAVE